MISGILAGGIPGFRTVTFLLLHPPVAIPTFFGLSCLLSYGWPACYGTQAAIFSPWSDVDVPTLSTECFLVLVGFVLLFVFFVFCRFLFFAWFGFFGLFCLLPSVD